MLISALPRNPLLQRCAKDPGDPEPVSCQNATCPPLHPPTRRTDLVDSCQKPIDPLDLDLLRNLLDSFCLHSHTPFGGTCLEPSRPCKGWLTYCTYLSAPTLRILFWQDIKYCSVHQLSSFRNFNKAVQILLTSVNLLLGFKLSTMWQISSCYKGVFPLHCCPLPSCMLKMRIKYKWKCDVICWSP